MLSRYRSPLLFRISCKSNHYEFWRSSSCEALYKDLLQDYSLTQDQEHMSSTSHQAFDRMTRWFQLHYQAFNLSDLKVFGQGRSILLFESFKVIFHELHQLLIELLVFQNLTVIRDDQY